MNITDYKKKYLKYKAKYLNIKGGASQSESKMDIGKAKAAVRNINFLITAFLPKDTDGEFNMKEGNNEYDDKVTSHTFNYYMRIYLLYEFEKSGNSINDSETNKKNYETLVNGLRSFGFQELKNYNDCINKECKDRSTTGSVKNYMNKLMYINAIYILSILKYDYIYNLYNWLIKNDIKKYESYCTFILNSIFALKLAIYYLIINSKNANDTYEESMFSKLGINEKKLLSLMNDDAKGNTKCNELFLNINGVIVNNYTEQIKKIKIELLEYNKLKENCEKKMELDTIPKKKELTNPGILDNMLPFIYSLIQQIYEYNQKIYNIDKKEDKDVDNSSTTGYNFDSFKRIPPIIIYRSLYVNDNYKSVPYYAEIKDAFTDTEKKEHSIEQKKQFSIVKNLNNKYIPIGCKQDGTIAYAYVV
jgi:hypothetical protein